MNPYLDAVHAALPRLLASFDRDALRASRGLGDRNAWAWKTIDFFNATPQGAVHGLARLVAAGLLPEGVRGASVIERIDEAVDAVARLTRADGSLEEAFPYEGSFCVTALVAYDLLVAREQLDAHWSAAMRERCLARVEPLIGYLMRADETHGCISNHVLTAVAALCAWHDAVPGASEQRAQALLARVLGWQSHEGWYREYDGADAGYQSLATCYLADVHRRRPHWGLRESLARSLDFLVHCAHRDGSFGGLYGSRNTRFLQPAGFEFLAADMPQAAALAVFARKAIARQSCVTLASIDAGNLAPWFNGYAWAAQLCAERGAYATVPALPCEQPHMRRWFPDAGLLFDGDAEAYTVVATHKGGVVVRSGNDGSLFVDAGVVMRDADGRLSTTQHYRRDNVVEITAQEVLVDAPLTRLHHSQFQPVEMIVLRILNVTLMRWRPLREWVKRRLAALLMGAPAPLATRNRRVVRLRPSFCVDDQDSAGPSLTRVEQGRPFTVIHMASQGYWQRGDDA
ncbi:MAG: hypothetical protein IPM80_23060 [Proteobacteria bacterium]|jgi:hypothetical protein|nr:hypothetical protein [Pseudomonadota bacterium]MBK8961225.1 hypothetical protein [Pseudomonadota bacterium]